MGIAAGVINCLAAFCVLFALFIEHLYSFRPSLLLGSYLSVTLIFDIVAVRSFFLRQITSEAGLRIAILASRAILMVLEELSKRSLFICEEKKKDIGKEQVAGFWGRALFLWLNPTLVLGFRKSFDSHDLDNVDDALKTETIRRDFQRHWSKGKQGCFHLNCHPYTNSRYRKPGFSIWSICCFLENRWSSPAINEYSLLLAVCRKHIHATLYHQQCRWCNSGSWAKL